MNTTGKRIVGIDLATTRSFVASAGVSWDDLDGLDNKSSAIPQIESFSWTGAYESGNKNPPTALYYKDPKDLPVTGNDLDRFIKRSGVGKGGRPPFDTERFFRLWKLMFHDNQNDPSTIEIQSEIQRKLDLLGKSREDLLREWVGATYRKLFVAGSDGHFRLKDKDDDHVRDIEIVVAVPPGRSVIAHEEVRRAFIQGPISSNQISLVSEPEAMFRAWIANGSNVPDWKVGNTYLVGDGGGGTCCFVRFRLVSLDPLQFTQEYESESIICGSETISNEFEKMASISIPSTILNRAWALDKLRRNFDKVFKFSFGEKQSEQEEYYLDMPWDRNGSLEFSHEQLAACFEPCMAKLIPAIRHQLRRGHSSTPLLSSQTAESRSTDLPISADKSSQSATSSTHAGPNEVNYLVLGGGLFLNEYVIRKITDTFPNLAIRKLSHDKSHVAKGAVLTRLYARKNFISSRPILRSKGLFTKFPIDDKIKKSPLYPLLKKEKDPRNKVEYFYGLQWLVKQGNDAVINHANDVYEIAAESSFETARIRPIEIDNENPSFSDTIETWNYNPGDDDWTACRADGLGLIDQNGRTISGYEGSQPISWEPKQLGVSIDGLELRWRDRSKKLPYRIIRYTFEMKMREVETEYWIKAYSVKNGNKRDVTAVKSKIQKSEAFFDSHQMSQSLSESHRLGTGLRLEDDPSVDFDESNETRDFEQQEHQVSNNNVLSSSTYPSMVAKPQIKETVVQLIAIDERQNSAHITSPKSRQEVIVSDTNSATTSLLINKKRAVPVDGTQLPPPKKLRSPLKSQNPQRRRIEGSGDTNIGAARKHGDCWTCWLRNLKCDRGKPECPQCSRVGLVCQYGFPIWMRDEKTKEAQRAINKQLIADYKVRSAAKRLSLGKTFKCQIERASGASMKPKITSPGGASVAAQRFDAENAKSFHPPMTAHRDDFENSSTLRRKSQPTVPRDEDEDLYGASPPPSRRQPQQHAADDMSQAGSLRRSGRSRREHHIPNCMRMWDEIGDDFKIRSDSESQTAESDGDYADEED